MLSKVWAPSLLDLKNPIRPGRRRLFPAFVSSVLKACMDRGFKIRKKKGKKILTHIKVILPPVF